LGGEGIGEEAGVCGEEVLGGAGFFGYGVLFHKELATYAGNTSSGKGRAEPSAVFLPKYITGSGFDNFAIGVEDEGIVVSIFFGPKGGHHINEGVACF
jgi:hypothetical protein